MFNGFRFRSVDDFRTLWCHQTWLAGQDSDEMEVLQSSESHRITPCLIAGSGEPHNSMD